jgi:RimJ/RimL family protein N-acetyltransferase
MGLLDARDGSLVGVGVLYNVDWTMGWGFLGVVGKSLPTGSQVIARGMHLFLHEIFMRWPLRKLYAEIPEYNVQSLASATRAVGSREAVVQDRENYGGRFWDVEIWSVTRDEFLTYAERVATVGRSLGRPRASQ